MSKLERSYMGVYVPGGFWNDQRLNIIEKAFVIELWRIEGERGCKKSNEYFSELFKMSVDHCEKIILRLAKRGYLDILFYFDENHAKKRLLKLNIELK